jgi:hypothetical protein
MIRNGKTLKVALDPDPEYIVTLVGESYNKFVQNLENKFPGYGRETARLLANKRDSLYNEFEVPKKNSDKMRKIKSPHDVLKHLQKQLALFVAAQFQNHPSSHGFVRGKSPRTAAEAIQKSGNLAEKEVTNVDIKGAFPSITGRVIRKMLRHDTKTSLSPWQINILSKIATGENDRLSTGSPASPVIFNWRLTSFDNELEKASTKRNWSIVRYADDLSVAHYRNEKGKVVELLKRMLDPLGLEIEKSKLKTYRREYKVVLGLIVTRTSIFTLRKVRRSLRGLANRFKGIYVEEVKNRYTHEEAGKIRAKIPYEAARRKKSAEASLGGHCAYLIGIDRPRKIISTL